MSQPYSRWSRAVTLVLVWLRQAATAATRDRVQPVWPRFHAVRKRGQRCIGVHATRDRRVGASWSIMAAGDRPSAPRTADVRAPVDRAPESRLEQPRRLVGSKLLHKPPSLPSADADTCRTQRMASSLAIGLPLQDDDLAPIGESWWLGPCRRPNERPDRTRPHSPRCRQLSIVHQERGTLASGCPYPTA